MGVKLGVTLREEHKLRSFESSAEENCLHSILIEFDFVHFSLFNGTEWQSRYTVTETLYVNSLVCNWRQIPDFSSLRQQVKHHLMGSVF
jgi:hypothetical protein